jgi:chorismate mutase
MASATFTLRAVDQTRAAFASVQNSLQRMQGTVKTVSRNFQAALTLGGFAASAQRLNTILRQTEENAAALGMTTEEADRLTVTTGAIDRGFKAISSTTAEVVSRVVSAVTGTQSFSAAAEAAAIRFERSRVVIAEINDQLADQIVNNELINGTEQDILRALENQLQKYEMRGRMTTDPVEKAKAALAAEKARGAILQQESNIIEKDRALYAEQLQLREQIEATMGREKDKSAQMNALFETRNALSLALDRVPKTGLASDIAAENDLREQRNRIDRDLIPLLQERYQLERSIGTAVAESFQTAVFEGGKFQDVLKALIKDILQLIFYQTVTRKVAGYITTALIGNPFSDVKILPSLIPPGRAAGGPVTNGRPYVVGEKGPELFVPSGSGNIIPNSAMRSGGGSGGMGGVTVNYNIAAGVTRGELVPILEAERKRLKAEIPDMVRRGGAYRAAFA